jgi:hypothetical protein
LLTPPSAKGNVGASVVLSMVARFVTLEAAGGLRALSRDVVVSEAIETEVDQIC